MSTRRRQLRATQADANLAVARAIIDGDLPARPATCSICGAAGRASARAAWSIVYHHHSYELEHHLDVIAVCRECHGRIHEGQMPDPTSGDVWRAPQGRHLRRSTLADPTPVP